MNYVVNPMQKKKTVRSWARRRIEHAMVAALKIRGFDRNGRRMVESDTSSMRESKLNGSQLEVTAEYAPKILIGTVNVHVLPGSIETSFAEVQRQAEVAVAKVLKTCGRYPCHRSVKSVAGSSIASYGTVNIERPSRKKLSFEELKER